jgi:hypothetical protein
MRTTSAAVYHRPRRGIILIVVFFYLNILHLSNSALHLQAAVLAAAPDKQAGFAKTVEVTLFMHKVSTNTLRVI